MADTDPIRLPIEAALRLLAEASADSIGDAVSTKDRKVAAAQVYATIAQVEEQRTSNLIALLTVGQVHTSATTTVGFNQNAVVWLLEQVGRRIEMPERSAEEGL